MFIKKVVPSLIKDSRGKPTIQIEVFTYEGKFKCSAPSGKSTGKSEVASYNPRGIQYSVRMLKVFCAKLRHKNFLIKKIDDIEQLSNLMKKFEEQFGKFGGNVDYAIEGAFLRAAAADNKKEVWELINDDVNKGKTPKMPMPVGNCIGGGLHSKPVKGKRPDFQEFLLIPKEKTYSRAVTLNLRAHEYAKKLLKSKKTNDEGAWTTDKTNDEVLEILKEIAKKYNLRIGLDVASSSFYEKGYYNYKNKDLTRDKVDQADYMERLVKKFVIFYLEDAMQEDDFSGFKEILNTTQKNKFKTLIVGDDLTTTNLKRTQRAARGNSINAMIIKPNQIGSILEVKKVVEFCKKHNVIMIFSHRSGETMDNILSDYCVGFGGQFMKAGIFGRERLIKMKRVMDIEKSLK
jgi:enolase